MIALPLPLERAYRVHLIEEVRAALRHDLRNCLGTIRNAAYFVRTKLPAGGAAELTRVGQCLDVIDREVSEATRLLEDGPGAEPPLARGAADAGAVAAHLIALIGSEATVEVDPAASSLRAAMPELELQLGLLCLLENAHSEPGRRVRVRVSRSEAALEVAVGDDGPLPATDGVERPALQAAFPARSGNAGLGLSIARRLARARGGRVTLQAAPGGGTEATLHVPLAQDGRR